jgi:hypothetical protein
MVRKPWLPPGPPGEARPHAPSEAPGSTLPELCGARWAQAAPPSEPPAPPTPEAEPRVCVLPRGHPGPHRGRRGGYMPDNNLTVPPPAVEGDPGAASS